MTTHQPLTMFSGTLYKHGAEFSWGQKAQASVQTNLSISQTNPLTFQNKAAPFQPQLVGFIHPHPSLQVRFVYLKFLFRQKNNFTQKSQNRPTQNYLYCKIKITMKRISLFVWVFEKRESWDKEYQVVTQTCLTDIIYFAPRKRCRNWVMAGMQNFHPTTQIPCPWMQFFPVHIQRRETNTVEHGHHLLALPTNCTSRSI